VWTGKGVRGVQQRIPYHNWPGLQDGTSGQIRHVDRSASRRIRTQSHAEALPKLSYLAYSKAFGLSGLQSQVQIRLLSALPSASARPQCWQGSRPGLQAAVTQVKAARERRGSQTCRINSTQIRFSTGLWPPRVRRRSNETQTEVW
jgi:hypothetical protein